MTPDSYTLTLDNFDRLVNKTILNRGNGYYLDGTVSDIEEINGIWTAEVAGTEFYTVTVSLENDQTINECFCDCPYDGDVCKHIVAVFFYLREELKNNKTKPKNKVNKKGRFEDVLSKINTGEFKTFISYYAAKNKDFKTAFEIYFADKDESIDIGEKYSSLIKKLIKQYSSRGFLDYRSSSGLAREIDKFIGDAQHLFNKNNYADAFAVACVLLKEMMEVITYCDDSSGAIGDTLCNIIELIGEIAGSAVADMKETIFNILQNELKNDIYFGYGDFGYELFYTYKLLAIELGKHKEFLVFTDAKLTRLTGKYDDYSRRFFNTEKIDFLEKTGNSDEAALLIIRNLDIASVRQGEVDKLMAKKDFANAKLMIAGGMEIAEKNKEFGTVAKWEKELLHIAELENDLELVRRYNKKFALEHSFDRQHYSKWKKTYTRAEWNDVIEQEINVIIEKINREYGNKKWGSVNTQLIYALAPVYIEEQYLDRLLDLVKKEEKLDTIMLYSNYLLEQYPEELLQMYLPALEQDGDDSSNRDHYAALVAKMKQIIKDIPSGREQVLTVAKKLKLKYPRRPAMIDELNGLPDK